MAEPKRILVIGSNSFSGASFSAKALTEGWTVFGVSRSPEPHDCFLPYRWIEREAQANFAFYQLDIRKQARDIAHIARDNRIPYIVNFAALGMVAESWQYPLDYYATNLLGNVALHEELRKLDSLLKYVHISTPEVYGSTTGLVSENEPLNPSTPYAASRAACDIHLQTYLSEHGFPVVWTRAANVYGPGQQPYRIIPRVALCHRLGQKLKLHGGGQSVRSFIHIDDVTSATLQIMADAALGSCYHISTERFISIKELAELVSRKMGRPLEDIAEIAPERPGKDHAYSLDASALRTTFGWKDSMGLEDGISQTIAWIDDWTSSLREQPLRYRHKP